MASFAWRGRILFALVLALVLLVSACGQRQKVRDLSDPKETVRVAMFMTIRANDWEQARLDGMKSRLKELNAELEAFSAEFNPMEQINQIEDAVTSGRFDAIVVHPIDAMGVVPVVEEALKKGLVVIAADAPIGPNARSLEPFPAGVASVVGRTGWSFGTWNGRLIVEACKDRNPCKVAYIIGLQALTIDQDRYEAIQEVIKDHPHIQIVSFQEGLYRRDTSYEVFQNVLQANPDIDVVASSGDQMTLGAYDAAREAGLAERIRFIGSGGSKEGCQALAEGKLFASGYVDIPYTEGELLIEYAVRAARGQNVPRSVDLGDLRPPLPAEGPFLTKQTVNQFQCQW